MKNRLLHFTVIVCMLIPVANCVASGTSGLSIVAADNATGQPAEAETTLNAANLKNNKQSTINTLEAAMAEIKSLKAKIDGIETTFRNELAEGKKRIRSRYDVEVTSVRNASQNKLPLKRGAFETEEEFRERVAKQSGGYEKRIIDLQKKRQSELGEIEQRVINEQTTQTADLRKALRQLADKEYILAAESLALEIGTYDDGNRLFPVSLQSKTTGTRENGFIQIAVKGTITLPKDAAQKFKQDLKNGLVRPAVAVRAGDGQIMSMVIVNDSDNQQFVIEKRGSITMELNTNRTAEQQEKPAKEEQITPQKKIEEQKQQTEAEQKADVVQKKEEKRDSAKANKRFRVDGEIIEDLKLKLQWVPAPDRTMNHHEAEEYARSLSLAGGRWRLPTRAELKSLYDRSKRGNAEPVFNVSNKWLWTSELDGLSRAWYFHFSDGNGRMGARDRSANYARVLAVRSRR